MKIICQKNELAAALTSLCRIIPNRTNLPILNGCLCEAREQTLTLQCTDLEITMKIIISAQVEEEGSTVVLARYLSDLVKKLPGEEVVLSWSEEDSLLDINYGASSSKLHTWRADDFPPSREKPTERKVYFQGGLWKRITRKVLSAAAQQEARINYAGVYMQFLEDSIKLAATDAYRLAVIKIPNNSGIKDCDLFIPANALIEVNRLAADGDELEIAWNEGLICFSSQNFMLSSRLINSQFPNYEKVIPEQPELTIEVDKNSLQTALERASLFISPDEHYAIASLQIDNNLLTVKAHAVDVGSLREEIALLSPVEGECNVEFNAKYLLEPLQVLDQEKVTLCFNGERGPAVYREESEDESYLHLVSPVCPVG
ncbi:MAG TPA: DNA polymerase III subunit beta [Syntrophomonadaceae bacterium]|nr:DNA polymerase III subunit beta [Syntrophomonadaceae bacterium]